MLFESSVSSLSNSFARAGDVFLTEGQTHVIDGFSMLEVDCGALESQFLRLCATADLLSGSEMPVFEVDSPVVRSAVRANKHRQGWSLHKHFVFPKSASMEMPHAPAPLLSSMSLSPPEKPFSWVLSLPDQHPRVVSDSSALEPLTQSFLTDLGLVPVENSASTHCWWAAAAGYIGISGLEVMLLALDCAQQRLGLPLAEAFGLLSAATSTRQIEMLVTALADNFHSGLLVVHEPCKGAFLFRSNMSATFIPYLAAKCWCLHNPATAIMLYTQDPCAEYGHFQECRVECVQTTNLKQTAPVSPHWRFYDAEIATNFARKKHMSVPAVPMTCNGQGVESRANPPSISPTLPFDVETSQALVPAVPCPHTPPTVLDASSGPSSSATCQHKQDRHGDGEAQFTTLWTCQWPAGQGQDTQTPPLSPLTSTPSADGSVSSRGPVSGVCAVCAVFGLSECFCLPVPATCQWPAEHGQDTQTPPLSPLTSTPSADGRVTSSVSSRGPVSGVCAVCAVFGLSECFCLPVPAASATQVAERSVSPNSADGSAEARKKRARVALQEFKGFAHGCSCFGLCRCGFVKWAGREFQKLCQEAFPETRPHQTMPLSSCGLAEASPNFPKMQGASCSQPIGVVQAAEEGDSSLSNSCAHAEDVFLTECQTHEISFVQADCGALESQLVHLCSTADLLADLPVLNVHPVFVPSAIRANKHRQGWSLHKHFVFPKSASMEMPRAPLLPSMSLLPPEKPLSWVLSLPDQHPAVLSDYSALEPVFPKRASMEMPHAPAPLLPSMSLSPPEKPFSWVLSLPDQHPAVLSDSSALEPLTQSFLTDLGLVPVENSASTHCWWAAAAGYIGISGLEVMLLAVDCAQQRLGLPLAEAFGLLSAATSTRQIEMLVTALADNFHSGLLVVHEPCKGAVLFRSNMSATFIPYLAAKCWCLHKPATAIMLYTQDPCAEYGHFQECRVDCVQPTNLKQTTLVSHHCGFFTDVPMHGKGRTDLDGCSCVGLYGVCLCGYRDRAQARFTCTMHAVSSPIDLDSDHEVEPESLATRPDRSRSPRSFAHAASTDRAEIAADAHVQEPAADGTTHAITMFWRARRACVADAVERLYQQHLQADATNADALAALFHSLPVAWPVQPRDFGVTLDLVFAHELELWRQRAAESAYAETTIVDAWNSQLDVVKLLPYFLAVVCMFAERAGIAREFPFAFMLALAPWVCHQDLHACFNARRPEHKVRPRFFMTLIAESNCGKSPFFRQCLDAVFVSHSGTKPCLTDTFRDRFVVPGPGKDKTLFLQTCTGSDFTKRMKATRGHLCWLSEEAWSALDVPWAKGKGKVSQNSNKVQHCFLLNTQNGCSYGPVSIQAEQFFVPTTNFCFFHAGQPKVIHDYWGQAFLQDCPFGGMGWEFRPTFLWPRNQPDDDESSPHVTFEGANRFMLDLLANLALKYGQTLDSKNFALNPLIPSDAAVPLWNKFRHEAESSKEVVPAFAAGAVGKYCFTTTAHIMACHLLEQSFLDTKDGNLSPLRSREASVLETTAVSPMPASMKELPAELILAAPSHLDLMLCGILTCCNEMKLPPNQRAGPPSLEETRCQASRRTTPNKRAEANACALSNDETALSILLQRFADAEHITVTNANTTIPRKLGFRSDQAGICRLFDLATENQAGVREGAPHANLRLRLTLADMRPEFRRHLNLHLSIPNRKTSPAESDADRAPFMIGAGKRGRIDKSLAEAPQRRHRSKSAPIAQSNPPAAVVEPEDLPKHKRRGREVLIQPFYSPQPTTAKEAEDVLNNKLAATHAQVHGQAFQTKAISVARKRTMAFQLRCSFCQHHTCTLRGVATHDSTSMLLSSWCMSHSEHGRPRSEAKSGRKFGENRTFPNKELLAYNGKLDHKSFARAIQQHFQNSPASFPEMTGAGKRPRKALQPQRKPATKDVKQVQPGKKLKKKPAAQAKPAQKVHNKTMLLDPIHITSRPVTAVVVEQALKADLQLHHEKVHGKYFHVKASKQQRKKKEAFQLRCGVCQHGTCSWRGSATFVPSTSMLSSSYMTEGSHGRPKTPKAASGRKSGQTGDHVFAVKESLVYEGGMDHQSIARQIEKHFADKPLQHSLLVRCKPRKATRQGPTCIFNCKTHFDRATQTKCKWGGAAKVVRVPDGGHELQLRYQRPDAHAPHEMQLYGTLTWRQRQAAKQCPNKDTHSVSQADHAVLPANAAKRVPALKPGVLAGFAARFRKKLRPSSEEAPRNPPMHVASDFEYCQDRCNASLHGGQCQLPPDSPSILPADGSLRVINMCLTPQHVCLPLICPEMLDLTLSLLPKPWHLKASTDGTYRLLFDSYALLTFGVNVKNWSLRKDISMFSFRSSFVPLAFALANKENDEAYSHLGHTLFATARTLQHELKAESILQWHGDMHLGIEAARKSLAPSAKRLSDWAHVTGATSQGPSGLHGFLSKELPPQKKSRMLPWLLQFCRISKELSALVFHVVWASIFAEMQQECGAELVTRFQKQYFESVRRGSDVTWDAPWRSAPDRIMPGTDAGSAPQESWHGQVLKPVLGHQRRKPAELAHMLQQHIVLPQLRLLRAMKDEGAQFQDWPGVGGFLDQHVLQGDAKLRKEGRTPGKTLLAWGLHSRFQDGQGNVWMLVPTSKLKTDWALSKSGSKKYKDRAPIPLPPHACRHFAALMTAESVAEAESALAALGFYDVAQQSITNWRTAAKVFDDWRCVVSGPFVSNLWQQHGMHPEEAAACPRNKHELWLCFGCHVASLWGPCEHAYCCMEHEGQSSTTPLPKAKPKGRPSKRAAKASPALPPQIVPGPSTAPSAPNPSGQASSSSASMPIQNLALRRLLRAASLGQFFQPMIEQGVTVPALRCFTFADFFALFRMSVGESHALMEALARAAALCFISVLFLRRPNFQQAFPLIPGS